MVAPEIPEELAAYFADDGVYHNVPIGPISGRTNVEEFIRGFVGSWTETTWDILNVTSSGNVVIAERLDRTRAGDKSVELPLRRRIRARRWQDQDLARLLRLGTYERGLA